MRLVLSLALCVAFLLTARTTDAATFPDTTPPVLTCSLQRIVMWPPFRGLFPAGFEATALDDCDGITPVVVTIYSDEGHGTAPYAPDAIGTEPSNLVLRGERAVPGDGRVFLIRATATDFSGNTSMMCKTAVVPLLPVGFSFIDARSQAEAAEEACVENGPFGPPPPGFTELLTFTWPPPIIQPN